MRRYFNSFPPEVRAEAAREAITALGKYYDGRAAVTQARIIVAAAVK